MSKNDKKQSKQRAKTIAPRKKKQGYSRRDGMPRLPPITQQVSVPVARARGSKTKAPQIRTSRAGGTVVRHKEYLFDLPATVAFDIPAGQAVVIQPGLIDSFPWLAQQAASYEMYVIHEMTFHYVQRSATSLPGSVYMAYQNDSADAPFGTKAEMMAYEGSQENVVYLSQDFKIKFDGYLKKYFVRSNGLDAGTDPQFYDLGVFSVTSVASTATPLVGEILVSYTVEFFKPKISTSMGAGYYVLADAFGSSLTQLHEHPLTEGLIYSSTEIPYSGYVSLTVDAASDTMIIKQAGVYLVACDFDTVTGGGVQTIPITLNHAMGANITLLEGEINTNINGAVAPQAIQTSWYLFNVSKSSSSTTNGIVWTTTGGTGITTWTCKWLIVQVQPGELGSAITSKAPARPKVRHVPGGVASKERKSASERKEEYKDSAGYSEEPLDIPPPLTRAARVPLQRRSNTPERSIYK